MRLEAHPIALIAAERFSFALSQKKHSQPKASRCPDLRYTALFFASLRKDEAHCEN